MTDRKKPEMDLQLTVQGLIVRVPIYIHDRQRGSKQTEKKKKHTEEPHLALIIA